MTEEELRELDGHWAAGMPIKQIARLMCYSFNTIADVLKSNRGRYPLRRKSFTQGERDTCSDCAYYREVYSHQGSNNLTHFIGVCIFEVANADTLAGADLVEVDPEDEPCGDFKEG